MSDPGIGTRLRRFGSQIYLSIGLRSGFWWPNFLTEQLGKLRFASGSMTRIGISVMSLDPWYKM